MDRVHLAIVGCGNISQLNAPATSSTRAATWWRSATPSPAGAIGEPSLVRIHTTRAQHVTGQAIELEPDALVWRCDPGRNPGGALYDDGVHK